MEEKIPKIIHYCWFGGKDLPELEKKCMKTWKKILPDYTFMFWNEHTFDINSVEWTKSAYKAHKYAFVADYVRLWALYKYGGVYLDTDIKMIKSFNDLLGYNGFMCFIDMDGSELSMGTIGIVPEHKLISEMMSFYDKEFTNDFIYDLNSNTKMMADFFVNHGLKLGGGRQVLGDIEIFPRTYFCPMDYFSNWDLTKDTYCIHLFSGSWLPDDQLKGLQQRRKLWWRIGKKIYIHFKNISLIKKLRDCMKEKKIIN